MWLRALAGAYAGEVRDYRTDVGLKALRSGTAARVDVTAPLTVLSVQAADQMTAAAIARVPEKKKRRR